MTPISNNVDETSDLNLLKYVLEHGIDSHDRTEIGTLSIFGSRLEFSLQNNTMPLLTTKKVFWNGVVEELFWFIEGNTNSKDLDKKGVKIWNANGSREFLDKCGFYDRDEGDLGPVYGYQWRHWGNDQLKTLIQNISKDPYSRRHILSAWNVDHLDKMVLPPCHVMSQFYVRNGKLSCHLYQRSADMFLGVPFNIASYALLTHLIAHVTNLKAEKLIISYGDVHVYNTHLDAIKKQLSNKPLQFPTISIESESLDIDNLKSSDIVLCNYKSHGSIKAEMAL